jgi:hypothetical protein
MSKSKKTKKLVTAKQAAAMDFKPWEDRADGWTAPSNEEWMPFGVQVLPVVRVARIMMSQTKAEMETMLRGLPDDLYVETIDNIGLALAHFQQFTRVLECAQARIIVASESALAKDRKGVRAAA